MLHAAIAAAEPEDVAFRFSGWSFRPGRWSLESPDGEAVELTYGEFQLLRALVERPGRVLSRDQLLELTRGPFAVAYDRAVDVQLCRLRKKLGPAAPIRTLVGAGYMFTARVERG